MSVMIECGWRSRTVGCCDECGAVLDVCDSECGGRSSNQ